MQKKIIISVIAIQLLLIAFSIDASPTRVNENFQPHGIALKGDWFFIGPKDKIDLSSHLKQR